MTSRNRSILGQYITSISTQKSAWSRGETYNPVTEWHNALLKKNTKVLEISWNLFQASIICPSLKKTWLSLPRNFSWFMNQHESTFLPLGTWWLPSWSTIRAPRPQGASSYDENSPHRGIGWHPNQPLPLTIKWWIVVSNTSRSTCCKIWTCILCII